MAIDHRKSQTVIMSAAKLMELFRIQFPFIFFSNTDYIQSRDLAFFFKKRIKNKQMNQMSISIFLVASNGVGL